MSIKNVLVVYEIAYKASQVKSKRAYKHFEIWVKDIVRTYHDAAIERVANMHLFRLRSQFAL
ncbi:MAG: hypothetical protein WDN47_05535 [Candidatus Doudnabacteria bacterium]